MATVREVTLELLRGLGITTIFGNPGSTELPLLRDFPQDFRYVLALQEASALGMAEGYARTSGNASLVNLHTAPGLGNAMGALVTAYHDRTPVIVTAGQQHRAHIATEPLLKGELTELAKPYVKRSHEPRRPEDVPREFLRAYHTAMTSPQGPVFLSVPMDDWDAGAEPVEITRVSHAAAPDPQSLVRAAEVIAAAENPAMVVGPGVSRSRVSGSVFGSVSGFEGVVALAERLRAVVFQEGVSALAGFPQSHPLFRGMLPLSQRQISERLSGHDVVLVLGSPVFTYYPYLPGPVVEAGTRVVQITDDPEEAARVPTGQSIVGDAALAALSLVDLLPEPDRPFPEAPDPPPAPGATDPMSVDYVMDTLAKALPEGAIVSDESTSSKGVFHRYVHIDEPDGYMTSDAGGLGFCMPAAIGAKLASPQRPVLCVIGDGSSLYSIQSLWTAAQYGAAVAFVVVNNRGYSILKGFRDLLGMSDVPGLDLPDADLVTVASGFGVSGERVEDPEDLQPALERAFAASEPYLVDAVVDTSVPSLL